LIRVHVAIVKSSRKTAAPDPLVILHGGPGAYSLDRIERTLERFAQVRAVRDIILIDQRGVGYSQPSLNCPEIDGLDVQAIDEELNDTEAFERRLAAYGRCRERLEAAGVELSNYSANALTTDLASLRQALGYDEWNVYGVSYGARQALMLMRDDPDGLRSVVLDSVYPVDIDLAQENAASHGHALSLLFAANETAHPEFEQAFFALVDELDTRPINIPAIIPERWVVPYQSFNGDDLLRLMISIVRRWPQSFVHMPGFIEHIEDGRYANLMELAKPSVGDQLFSEGMNLSVICQDIDPDARRLNDNSKYAAQARAHAYAEADREQRMALCQLWLGEAWELRPQAPAASDIPTLVLRGEQDALIPAAWDTQATEDLSNTVRLTFPKSGHGVMTSSPCAREAVATFLLDPTKMSSTMCGD
jgi:pimeloyl-ACP methyl ester carboxylesterase